MKLVKHFDENTAPELEQALQTLNKLMDNMESFLDERVDNYPAIECAGLLYRMKDAHEAVDSVKKRFFKVKDRLDKGIVPAKMESEGSDLIRVPELGRSFSSQTRTSASIIDKPKAYAWLREIGQGEIIQETVNAGTLSSFVRSLMVDQGIEPPVEAVKVTSYNAIGIAKYTPKTEV